ncbi:hypothetical protein FN846DRAFT_893166 [Sphaerosporella brunnea]|uniref:RRM domain-containing protein n=1 Tax=Sphaerosporella brunnea TaxID=1250544 RepID=A0A5J5EP94_9PEZI|nr:hypothetical protein FN846DRAFT_893166 [Sphaerosporella brunnea]
MLMRPGPRTRVFIGNVPFSITHEELKELFFGYVAESTTVPIHPAGRGAGYGFVDLTTKKEADHAIAALDGMAFQGQTVSVQLAKMPRLEGRVANVHHRKWNVQHRNKNCSADCDKEDQMKASAVQAVVSAVSSPESELSDDKPLWLQLDPDFAAMLWLKQRLIYLGDTIPHMIRSKGSDGSEQWRNG